MSDETLRIIDANLNRLGEGLRLLEEIARLVFNDVELTRELKVMRHKLLTKDTAFNIKLLRARNAASDVGAELQVSGQEEVRELPLVVVANARRAQESLRVLEELAKLPDFARELDPAEFSRGRFALYTVEQKLMARLQRKDMLERLRGLYIIVDTDTIKGRSHIDVARQAIKGGAKAIQLRDKTMTRKELLPIARDLKDLCAEGEALFIVNDYLDIALESDADGLHVGQEDLPVRVARRWLPADKILGASARTVELAKAAQADDADYLGVGAMYPTVSKVKTVVVGLDRLRQIKQAVSLPLVAIGGINKDNAAAAMAAGASAVAVMGAVAGAENPEEAARQIVASIEAKG
ncbi:MAG: thiamine phosphate synthase [Chloroflexi bacterium]|nr:thiamine phosphate synthase [Chloroflexota bacterium]